MILGLCACGCGGKIQKKNWHKYRNAKYISGHNVRIVNPLSLLDKVKDNRKGQTGFLAPKTIGSIKHDAIKAGRSWELDDIFAFGLITGECTYCGKKANWPHTRNGIDRVDSRIDYTHQNCVSCCKHCNHAKSNRTTQEFEYWAVQLYFNLMKKRASHE